MERPDVLVLGAGGTIGAAWMGGVLAGIASETGIDFAAVEHIVGTSAGSMLAADLLAGVEPRAGDPRTDASGDEASGMPGADEVAGNGALRGRAGRLGGSLASIAGTSLAPLALSLARPGGALVRAAALARI